MVDRDEICKIHEEAFIKVTFEEDKMAQYGTSPTDPMYDPWVDQCTFLSLALSPPQWLIVHACSFQQV